MEIGIKMCHADNEKPEKRNNGRNRTAKSQKIRILGEKENSKDLGMLEANTVKISEMKEKIRNEYFRRTRKLLEFKLCSRNLIKGINTWAVPFIRFSGLFLNCRREVFGQMGQ